MNINPDNLFVNQCEYTPVYLIQNTGVTQPKSFVIKQDSKPLSDNLKRFYENSGNLETSFLLTNTEQVQNQSVLNKVDTAQIGNNLKLASFLLPKGEPIIQAVTTLPAVQEHQNTLPKTVNNIVNQQLAAAGNFVLKQTALKGSTNIVYKVNKPLIDINRKDVKKQKKKIPQNHIQARILPKICPKENATPQLASVQLLKLGGTYHSLNNLNNNQIKIVNHALKNIEDVDKLPKEPTYDPVTNTRIVYKVVSPKDLKVVGKNKIVFKEKKAKPEAKDEKEDEPEVQVRKITRSGRVVKSPKYIEPGIEPNHKPKKRNNPLTCFQCSAEFNGLYNLQKHYDNNPTHIPAKIHTNLFHCLLAIINGSTKENQANIFIQQLELLVAKLRSLLPCLLKKLDGVDGKTCTINNDLGRILDMEPGSYDLNIEALNCIKNINGKCVHNQPPKTQFSSDLSKPSQLWLSKHNEEIANSEVEAGDCARNTAVDKWPTVIKRVWKLKKLKSQMLESKKIKLDTEKSDFMIQIEPDEFVLLDKPEQTAATVPPVTTEACSVSDNRNIIQTNANGVCPIIQTNVSNVNLMPNINGHVNSPIRSDPQINVSYKRIEPDVKLMNKSDISQVPDLNEIHNNIDDIQNTNLHSPFETAFDSEIQNNTNIFLNNKLEATTSSFASEQFDNVISNTSKVTGKSKVTNEQFEGAQFETDVLNNPTSVIDDIHDSVLRDNEFDTEMNEDSQDEKDKPKKKLMNFHSTHFDIRSSPIKPSSAVFRKFQIKPQEISKFEVHIIRPLQLDLNVENENARDGVMEPDANTLLDLQTIRNDIEMQCKDALLQRELSFDKAWVPTNDDNSHESYMKPNNLIKPSMIHVKDDSIDNCVNKDLNQVVGPLTNNETLPANQGQSVLQFFDLGNDCLSYPEAEIRNNAEDFNLDLFSFNNA